MSRVADRCTWLQTKKDAVKEHCKRINARIERNIMSQAEWTIPDPGLKGELVQQIMNEAIAPYNNFWNAYTGLNLLQNPQKHFKCVSLHELLNGCCASTCHHTVRSIATRHGFSFCFFCRYTPQEVNDMVQGVLFGGAPVRPGVIKK